MNLYNNETWYTVEYNWEQKRWERTGEEAKIPGTGNADRILGKSAAKLAKNFLDEFYKKDGGVTEKDIKELLALDLSSTIDKTAAGPEHNQYLEQLYDVLKEKSHQETYVNLLVDFQISQMKSLGKKMREGTEDKIEGSKEWNRAVDVTRYPETMYIAQAEILLKDLYPEVDRNKKFEERLERQKWDYEDRKDLMAGMRKLALGGSYLDEKNPEELKNMFRQFKGPVEDEKSKNEKSSVFYDPKNFPFWDGIKRRVAINKPCAFKYSGTKLSLVWYEKDEMAEQEIKDFEGEKGTAFKREFLENKKHSFDYIYDQIIEKFKETFAEKKDFYSDYADKLHSEVKRFDKIFEQKEKLDKMIKTQLRLDHGLVDVKEEHELKFDLEKLLSERNKYSGEMISYLEQKRAGFLAEAGGVKPENLESGKAENFQQAALLKVHALDEMLKTAEIFNKDLTETAKSKAVEEQEKRTPGMVKAGEDLLKKENKESTNQKMENLRSALDEGAEWAKDGSPTRKRFLYEENLKRIADVTKRLSSTHKKENDPDSEYFTNMMTRLNEFGEKKENDRDKMIEACETYIKKRKGIFFGPQTAVGKERLNLAKEALGILKELETEKVLTKEEVKNWDEQRADKEALREEYRQVRERAREREERKELQEEQDEYWEENFDVNSVRVYNSKLKGAGYTQYSSYANLFSASLEEYKRLEGKTDLTESEKIAKYFVKRFNDGGRGLYEHMSKQLHMAEDSSTYGGAIARDKCRQFFGELGNEVNESVKELIEIEDKEGWSPETEQSLQFFMSIVKDGEHIYQKLIPWDRGDSGFSKVQKIWNDRENGKVLREAYHVMKQATELGFGTDDTVLSMQDQERKKYYETLTETLKTMSDRMYQSKGGTTGMLYQLRREFDDVVHYTSETDEKQLAALNMVSSAMKQVEKVYPRFKKFLEPEEEMIQDSVLEDAYYLKDAEKKLMGFQAKQKEDIQEKAKAPAGKSGSERNEKQKLSFDDLAKEEGGSEKKKNSSKTKIPMETEKNKTAEKTELKPKSKSAK
ncbi:hypothetical protein [Brotaphodocola sp.]|uniref:hypothetical protein n=1 Tax=Brotaphodocola sp. TaxID=3073577 RepID=UPI003D7E3F92